MRKLLCALCALCLLLAGCAGGEAADELTAVFFNVGKADAILLYNGEMAVLIDAGENGDGKDVAEALCQNTSFTLGGCEFSIDVANRDDYGEDEENDFSLVVRLTHGEVRFLFAGDAENARLAELLDEGDLSSDVLKVPHHGRYADLSAAFFAVVSPQYAVITSDEDDPEDPETVRALEAAGAQVLFTREGTVTLVSDGEGVRAAQ